jgi:hypothetical protein
MGAKMLKPWRRRTIPATRNRVREGGAEVTESEVMGLAFCRERWGKRWRRQ